MINPETGRLQLKYIADSTKHISDYSTNLLGIFELQHLNICLTSSEKKIYNDYCLPEETVDTPIFNEHFEVKNIENYFTLNVSELDNYEFPYEHNNETHKVTCSTEHTPMKWNFWYFSIRWLNSSNEYLHSQTESQQRRGWARQVSSAAKAIIAQFAKTTEPNYFVIPKKCYLKMEDNF